MKTTDPTPEDKGTPSSAPGRMTFWRKRWVKITLVAMAVCFGVAGAGALWLGQKYSERAARIDLSTLGQTAEGTAVLDRKGELLGTLFDDNLGQVPLSDVPKHVIEALIATEDVRFYEHRGVDYRGIGRATVKNVLHRSVKQGGSTITQQLARQAFKLKGRTLDRKLLETFVARRIEDGYSKEQILEFYLNRIYLGHGFYGIGAAARGYFGKNVPDLTLEEGAVLVGIIKAPVPYSPFKDPQEAKRVRDLTLKRMHSVEFIDGARLEAALANPVQVLSEKARLGKKNYVLAAVEQDLEEQAKKGSGGPWKSVRVTVDAGLQAHLDALVRKHVKQVEEKLQPVAAADGSNAPLQAAAVIIDNVTGEVLATCGGRDFASSPFDRVRQGQRPAGTTFIPLTYAAAYSLKPDLPDRQVLDAPMDNRRVMVGGSEGQLGEWGAESDAPHYEGYLPVPTALLLGKNGAAVRLAVEAGLEEVQARLQNGGFTTPLQKYPGIVLGNSPVLLTDLARAYAALAQGGELPGTTSLVTESTTDQGQVQTRRVSDILAREKVFASAAAESVRHTLVMSLQKPAYQEVLTQHGLAGKGLVGWGGTAHGFTDALFVGGDQHVTCAVWMGFDEPRAMKVKEADSGNGEHAWAWKTTFPLWAEVIAAATGGHPRGWPGDAKPVSAPILAERGKPSSADHQKEVLPAPGAPEKGKAPHAQATATALNGAAASTAEPARPREPALIGNDPYQAFVRSRE